MTAKEHYDKLLASVYTWMAGDFETGAHAFSSFLQAWEIRPISADAVAVDLGAGYGVQSAPLARLGYRVKAVDFSRQLLDELVANTQGLPVEPVHGDIRRVNLYNDPRPEVIVCWGDTLTHLDNTDEIGRLLRDCCLALAPGGKILLQFRDYTTELTGEARFIPVKSDDNRIMTCFLEYDPSHVHVTDLVYEYTPAGWQQQVSSYRKVRLSPDAVRSLLSGCNMNITCDTFTRGMVNIIAEKQRI